MQHRPEVAAGQQLPYRLPLRIVADQVRARDAGAQGPRAESDAGARLARMIPDRRHLDRVGERRRQRREVHDRIHPEAPEYGEIDLVSAHLTILAAPAIRPYGGFPMPPEG